MLKSKLFSLFITLYLVFVNSTSITHHHNDGEFHPDCQICVLQINQQSEDPNSLTFIFKIQKHDLSFDLKPIYQVVLKYSFSKTFPRGPPAFSLISI